MPAKNKIRSVGNLLQNPQEAVITTNICFLTNFIELELTNVQANYWMGQMHCGPPNQNFGGAMAPVAPAAAPPMLTGPVLFKEVVTDATVMSVV